MQEIVDAEYIGVGEMVTEASITLFFLQFYYFMMSNTIFSILIRLHWHGYDANP
jgi:hypothetical protein